MNQEDSLDYPLLRSAGTLLLLALWPQAVGVTASDNWPQWRGADMTAVVDDDPQLPEHWTTTDNVAWRQDIAGVGWSSPIVWGNKIFLTSVVADETYEGPSAGLYLPATGSDTPPDPPPGTHHWMVMCLDLDTGQLLWRRTAHQGVAPAGIHPKNSFASATPVTDGERVYVLFGNLGLFAYDFHGVKLWSRNLEARADRWGWGPGSSPALLDNQLLVLHDNEQESYLASFDTATGDQNWRVVRDEVTGWSTPFVWRNDIRTEIITTGKRMVRSYDTSGNLIWYFSGQMTDVTIPTPIPGDGIVYVSSGYVGNNHRPVYAVLPGAEGDITLGTNQTANEYIRWYQPRVGAYNPSPILYRGIYYTLLDRGFLTAHDAFTGQIIYDRVRIEPGATFTSSPWAYNGKIFALSEDGNTYVIAAGAEYQLLGKNELEELSLASPAIAGGTLLLRTASSLYAIRR